jgi:hypothetical protein
MVAVIHTSRHLRRCLYYNEQKVAAGNALLLEAGYYPMAAQDMNFHQKLARLEKLTELNQQTKCNCVHISLNFDPSEKLSPGLLIKIAELYLEKIGFAGQPYLLYEHFDAGHPHVHLVTTQIKPDGKAIRTQALGKNESSKARREIEALYGLMRAEGAEQRKVLRPVGTNTERVQYGQMETKRAIERVLQHVLKNYKLSSLTQLNAVLGLYNLTADAGTEHSWLRRHGGLIYHVLDKHGNKIGIPVKASDLLGKPTLKAVEGLFARHEAAKRQHCPRVRNAINLALVPSEMSLSTLHTILQKDGIDLVVCSRGVNAAVELIYVDHIQKVVFSGDELGLPYNAASILKRCRNDLTIGGSGKRKALTGSGSPVPVSDQTHERKDDLVPNLAQVLFGPGPQPAVPDWHLRRRRKRRKKQARQPQ